MEILKRKNFKGNPQNSVMFPQLISELIAFLIFSYVFFTSDFCYVEDAQLCAPTLNRVRFINPVRLDKLNLTSWLAPYCLQAYPTLQDDVEWLKRETLKLKHNLILEIFICCQHEALFKYMGLFFL